MNPEKLPSVSLVPKRPDYGHVKYYFKHITCYNCKAVGNFCVDQIGTTNSGAMCNSCTFRTVAPHEFVNNPNPCGEIPIQGTASDTVASAGPTVGFYGSPPGGKAIKYEPTTRVRMKWNSPFEKLKKKYTAGLVISLRRAPGASNVGISLRESQEFLIRELDEEHCALLLSPVKDGRVADVSSLFTAAELNKFTVTLASLLQQDPTPQKDQLMDHRTHVTVQSYYERWE